MRSVFLRTATLLAAGLALCSTAVAQTVVISQVYGGGGNGGATYQNDFIEIFNNGTGSVSLGGMSVQYAASAGTSWSVTPLPSINLAAGKYLLVQEASSGAGGVALPPPEATGTISMSGTNGKVALVNSTTALSGSGCPITAPILDLLGYGSASCSETSPTAALGNTTSATRKLGGCTDSNNNLSDFSVIVPVARNTGTVAQICSSSGITIAINDVSVTEGNSGQVTAHFIVSLSAVAPVGGVTFNIATADSSATVANSDYVAHSISGATIAAGNSSLAFDVLVNGDTNPETTEQFLVNITSVVGANVADGQGVGTILNDDAQFTGNIGQIQGNGAASPHANQVVRTTGNVVTVLSYNGFYMQSPPGNSDNDPLTSDGIFVFTSTLPTVSVGNVVDVQGSVVEFNGMTEFTNTGLSVTVTAPSGPHIDSLVFDALTPSPDPTQLSCAAGSFLAADPIAMKNFECFEGMLVQVANGTVSAPNQQFASDDIAEFFATASGTRAFREPGVEFPGLGTPGIATWDGNPEIFEVDTNRFVRDVNDTPDDVVLAGGAQFNAIGVIGDVIVSSRHHYELWTNPDNGLNGASFAVSSQPVLPAPVPGEKFGELAIGSQNMLRLFDDVNDPGVTYDDCTPGSADDCPSTAQFNSRVAKLSAQVRNVLLAPAVIAVQEVENINALTHLADRIHGDNASLTYTPYLAEGNDVGGIDVGFLVRSDITGAIVQQLGKTATTLQCSGTPPCPLHDRPPLLLTANFRGMDFAVLALHNRSLSGIADPSDGDRIRHKRLEQAQAVGQMVQDFQIAHASVPLIVLGDFNAYEFSDGYVDVVGQVKGTAVASENLLWAAPVVTPILTDASLTVPAGKRYSFVFDGYSQDLDHTLLTAKAQSLFVAMAYAHGNADVTPSLLTNNPTALRSADHDGTVIYLSDRIFANDFE